MVTQHAEQFAARRHRQALPFVVIDVENDLAGREEPESLHQDQDHQDHDDRGKNQYAQANGSHCLDRYS
jgi:hypothetical protein